jgi:outer membrane protein TolC
MAMHARNAAALALGVILGSLCALVKAESLDQAWSVALGVNQLLQSQQSESVAAGLNAAAARSARLPSVRTFNFNTVLTNSPGIKVNANNLLGAAPALGAVPGAATPAALPAAASLVVPALGRNQSDIPLSLTMATLPLYTGGRLLRNIDAANYQLNARRTEEQRSALDLKLLVADAYISVLRARQNLRVAKSNVAQLGAFRRDVSNRRKEGMAIRSDELAAAVSHDNAIVGEIQARTNLEAALATYNRYLDRPLETRADLEELSYVLPESDWTKLATDAMRIEFPSLNDAQVQELTDRALQIRPELNGLTQQAGALGAQADVTMAAIKPQVGLSGGFLFFGNENLVPQGFGVATFYIDWTLTDGGVSRRRAEALRVQERATIQRRADTAANIALEVRTRWLDLQQSRQRVPVARVAIAQAEENSSVVLDRYRQQLSTYTEVLDAETRRVQSLSNYYNARYDENLAFFRLRRAVGDL